MVVWKEFIGLGLYEIIPGFALSALAIVLVSLFDRAPSDSMAARFAKAEQAYADARDGC